MPDRIKIEHYGPGTGPMHANKAPLEHAHQLKLCAGKCGLKRDPKGGVQVNPNKWVCAKCWRPTLNARRSSKGQAMA